MYLCDYLSLLLGAMKYHATTKVVSALPINFVSDTFTDTGAAVARLSALVRAHGKWSVSLVVVVVVAVAAF